MLRSSRWTAAQYVGTGPTFSVLYVTLRLQISPLIEAARRHVSMATHPDTAAAAVAETYLYCMSTPTRADVNPRWADAVYADDLHYV